ncbi:MAG: DoxX family protein [Persicimonas sp.]
MAQMDDDAVKAPARGVFRIMLSGIFIVAGLNHLLGTEKVAGRLENAPMGHLATALADPTTLVLLAGVALLVGGLALLVGLYTRLAAVGLIALIIPITLTVQTGGLETLGPLFKNIGLAGGLIYFATHGADVWSLDAHTFFRRKH